MRVAAILLLTLCLGLAGCAGLSKRGDSARAATTGVNGGAAPPRFPTAGDKTNGAGGGSDPLLGGSISVPAPPPGPSANASQGVAILAGRVIDGNSKPPANTSIHCESVDDKSGAAKPIDIAVSPEGYFTIQGLKQGGQYKLIARGKDGSRAVAQTGYFTAPNVRVLIQMHEDFAGAAVPSPLGNPAFDKNKAKDPPPAPSSSDAMPPPKEPNADEPKPPPEEKKFEGTSALPKPKNDPSAWSPGLPAGMPAGYNVGAPNSPDAELPARIIVAPPDPTRPPPAFAPGVTGDPRPGLPVLDIPVPRNPGPSPSIPNPPASAPGNSSVGVGPTRVPSIVLVGKQLVNFALNDINGEPWEFRTQKRGKLILIDFWSTTCIPCRQTVPVLRSLQNQYGPQGLEIVGVACEGGGTPQEQAYRVNGLAQRLQLNYRQLLSTGSQCVVRQQFGIRAVPTLIVVDEQGWILWRHEGAPDRATNEELERLIQRRLNPNGSF